MSVVLVVVPVLVLQCWCRGVDGATTVDVGIGVNSCFRWGNRGALGFAACLTSYGAYCAVDNYHSVRAVQQRVRKHYDQSHQS